MAGKKEDVMARNRINRPKLDAYRFQASSETIEEQKFEVADPRLADLQVVSLTSIRAGEFQSRIIKNEAKDEQLRRSLQKSLQHNDGKLKQVFPVMIDPRDERYYNPAFGGHRRLEIAAELGVTEVYILVIGYDAEQLAYGTFAENDLSARQELSIVEEGNLYRKVRTRFGWTQAELAERFSIEGGQSHVSRCETAATYPDELQQMLIKSGGDRGMRAAKALFQLEKHFGHDKAVELWTPLIASFLNGSMFTDDIEKAVERYIGKEDKMTSPIQEPQIADTLTIRRQQRAASVRQKWQSFRKVIGDEPLSAEVKAEIEAVYQEMGEILERSS